MTITAETGAGGAPDLSTGNPAPSPFEKTQAEYKAQLDALIKQQNNLVASLDSRQGAGNPFFALAQGFLAPTKGGGFGESAGNAMQLFGAQQEQERKLNQETAMMRMQLAQASLAPAKEKYGMEREKAMGEALKTQLGGGANAVAGSSGATAGATGVGSVAGAGGVGGAGGAGVFGGMPESVRRAIAFRASYGDTAGATDLRDKWEIENAKVPEKVKEARMLSALLADPVAALTSYAQAIIEKPTLDNNIALQTAILAITKGGAEIADIAKRLPPDSAAIVKRSLEKLQELGFPTGNALKQNEVQGAPIGNKFEGTREQAFRELNDPRNAGMNQTDRKNVTDAINDYFNRLPAGRTGSSNSSKLSMEQLADIEKQRIIEELKAKTTESSRQTTERAKAWEAKDKALAPYADINFVETNNSRYDELLQLVGNKNNADVFGLLSRKKGVISALLSGAQDGMQTPYGNLSLPIYTMIQKLELTPEKQAVARNVMQILADLNQTVMRAGKDIYGPQISIYDAQKMEEPGFKISDPATFIKYLAQKQKITNEYLGIMANEREKYFDEKPNATTASFYNSGTYRDIAAQYHKVFRTLVASSPYR